MPRRIDMNIYLIGYRCTGKTTLGRALAERLSRPFVDMDDALTAAEGRSITEIVQAHGWDHFRELEKTLLQRLACRQDLVVGTGGGIILAEENRRILRDSGKVVWLRCRPETIERLMTADPRSREMRPSLTAGGLREEIATTLAAREPLYRETMDIALETDDFDINRLCSAMISALRKTGAAL